MLLLKLAIRNIMRWRRRSLLTGLSMTFGYFMASFSISISEGSYGNMIDVFTRSQTGHIQIHADDYLDKPSIYKRIYNVDEVLSVVDQVPGVVSATPRILTATLAFGGEKSSIAQVFGIDLEREVATSLLGNKVKQGTFITGAPSADGYDVAMIGATLAQNLKIGLGDELILIGQGADGSIANDIFMVGAIVGTKDSAERLNVYLSIEAARRFLSMGPVAHEIAIVTEDPDKARKVSSRIAEQLDNDVLSVAPWQVVEEAFYRTMTADKNGNYVSVGIIIAIVAIGVLNTVLMSMLERMREFGLLRAIGTRPRQIFNMIVVETLMLASLGCLFGFALALPTNLYLAKNGIPIGMSVDVAGFAFDSILGDVSLLTLGAPAVVVLFSAFLVSLMPAIKASRVVPVDALKAV